MPVTQQLARVSAPYLAARRQAAAASPDGNHGWRPAPEDSLDLDWAPALLQRACALAGLDRAHLDAVTLSTDGDADLDLGFLHTYPYDIAEFGPPPTGLSPTQVAHVAALLADLDFEAVLHHLPTDPAEATSALAWPGGTITGGPQPYLRLHFAALRTFYAEAARRSLLVVAWWD